METKLLNTAYRQLIKKSVDVYDKQHQAISQNVANANNDAYRRVNTDFSAELQAAVSNSSVKTTNDKHIKHSSYEHGLGPAQKPSAEERVDLAREMTDLTVTQIRHEFVTRALARHYSGISSAIVGRVR